MFKENVSAAGYSGIYVMDNLWEDSHEQTFMD